MWPVFYSDAFLWFYNSWKCVLFSPAWENKPSTEAEPSDKVKHRTEQKENIAWFTTITSFEQVYSSNNIKRNIESRILYNSSKAILKKQSYSQNIRIQSQKED